MDNDVGRSIAQENNNSKNHLLKCFIFNFCVYLDIMCVESKSNME